MDLAKNREHILGSKMTFGRGKGGEVRGAYFELLIWEHTRPPYIQNLNIFFASLPSHKYEICKIGFLHPGLTSHTMLIMMTTDGYGVMSVVAIRKS